MREKLPILWNMPRREEEILKVSKMLHLQNQRWCGAYYGELRQMLENYGWQESWTQRLMAVLVVQASLLCLSACAASSLLCCCCLCCCSAASLPSQCSALTSSRHSAGVWRELECDAKRNIGIQWRETVHSLSVVAWTKCINYKGKDERKKGLLLLLAPVLESPFPSSLSPLLSSVLQQPAKDFQVCKSQQQQPAGEACACQGPHLIWSVTRNSGRGTWLGLYPPSLWICSTFLFLQLDSWLGPPWETVFPIQSFHFLGQTVRS